MSSIINLTKSVEMNVVTDDERVGNDRLYYYKTRSDYIHLKAISQDKSPPLITEHPW